MEPEALAAGAGTLRLVHRLGGSLQLAALPCKPLKLLQQPPATRQEASRDSTPSGTQEQAPAAAAGAGGAGVACRVGVSSRTHLQLYRLVESLFPKLEQLQADLYSGAVVLRDAAAACGPGGRAQTPSWRYRRHDGPGGPGPTGTASAGLTAYIKGSVKHAKIGKMLASRS